MGERRGFVADDKKNVSTQKRNQSTTVLVHRSGWSLLLGRCRPFADCLLSWLHPSRSHHVSVGRRDLKFEMSISRITHAPPSTVVLLLSGGTNRHDARCRSLTSKGSSISGTRTTTVATARMKILRNTSRSSWLDGRSMGLRSPCFEFCCADHASGRGDGQTKQGLRREEAASQGP